MAIVKEQTEERVYRLVEQWAQGEISIQNVKVKSTDVFVLDVIYNSKVCSLKYLSFPQHREKFQSHLVLINANHDNVIKLYKYLETEDYGLLLMEQCDNDLMNLIESKLIDEDRARKIFFQTVSAVNHLHKRRIAHLDIRPENIGITSEGDVKLTNFCDSVSVESSKSEITNILHGSVLYLPPECNSRLESYDPFKADVWSLGILLHVLLMNSWPYSGAIAEEMVSKAICGELDFIDFAHSSPRLLLLLDSMLDLDPTFRPSCKEILKHAWLVEEDYSSYPSPRLVSPRSYAEAQQRKSKAKWQNLVGRINLFKS